jgi:hypothetical protein
VYDFTISLEVILVVVVVDAALLVDRTRPYLKDKFGFCHVEMKW